MSRRPTRPSQEEVLWLNDYLPYRLGVVASHMLRDASQVYKRRPRPVTTPQFRILAILANFEPLKASDIARISMLDKVAISRGLSELQRRRFVTRERLLDDKRTRKVTLTGAGWRYYLELVPEMKRRERLLREILTDEELKMLFAMLDRFDGLQARPKPVGGVPALRS